MNQDLGLAASTMVLSADTAVYLFRDNPSVISMCLLAALNTMPLFALLAGNNQTAVDAGSGALRYLLPRASRTEIFFSRLLSGFALFSLLYGVIMIYALFLSMQIDGFALTDTFRYTLGVLLHILLYGLPFLCLMAAISAWCRSALGTLLLGMLLMFILSLLVAWYHSDVPLLQYLLPTRYKQTLLFLYGPDNFSVYAYLLLYSGCTAMVGWWLFQRRDL